MAAEDPEVPSLRLGAWSPTEYDIDCVCACVFARIPWDSLGMVNSCEFQDSWVSHPSRPCTSSILQQANAESDEQLKQTLSRWFSGLNQAECGMGKQDQLNIQSRGACDIIYNIIYIITIYRICTYR